MRALTLDSAAGNGFEFAFSGGGSGPRVGQLATPHGPIDTPAFMPVGTQATVKGLTADTVAATGTQVVLANTYHLAVRPGADVIARLGGLHRVMSWDRAILTDSGGFQVFSLGRIRRVRDDGVLFANHVDGGELLLTPAGAIEIQRQLGADIIMAFDECVAADATHEQAAAAVRRTTVWARQCRDAWLAPGERQEEGTVQEEGTGSIFGVVSENGACPLFRARSAGDCGWACQALFGIVQGGVFADLRRQSVDELTELELPGYAIGGLSVGEGHDRMVEILAPTAAALPADRPRYLMGVGQPRDLLAAVGCGVDMFDCVLPTRNGRNGLAFTNDGPARLRNERFKLDPEPVEPGCDCTCCRRYSRGAVRHLMQADEMLGPMLVSEHNVRFFQRLMASIRDAIRRGEFETFARGWLARYQSAGGEADAESGNDD